VLVFAKEHGFIDNIKDEYGNKIGYVNAVDEEFGYIIVYDDIEWMEKENKFQLKSMRVRRIYTKFKVEK
jgi:hypothetical protein